MMQEEARFTMDDLRQADETAIGDPVCGAARVAAPCWSSCPEGTAMHGAATKP
jgi:hypothetical protein